MLLNAPSTGHSMPFWEKLVELLHEVILQLIKSKCFPVLYYGLEACRLRKSQYNSINYVISSIFRKIFNTRSQYVVDICLEMFNCLPAENAIAIHKGTF